MSFAPTYTGLERVLVQKCYRQEKMVPQASYQSLMVAKTKQNKKLSTIHRPKVPILDCG